MYNYRLIIIKLPIDLYYVYVFAYWTTHCKCLPGSQPFINISKHLLYIWWCAIYIASWFAFINDNSRGRMISHIFLLLNCKYYYWTANYDYFLSFGEDDCDVHHIKLQSLNRLHIGCMCLYVVKYNHMNDN